MGNHANNIKNELAYFYKVIKNMDSDDNIKRTKINKHETSIEEVSCNKISYECEMDKLLFKNSLLGWIELIENEKLHKAVKSLSIEDQIFISYIVKECKTQRELAQVYNITHQNIHKKFNFILEKLRKLLK